MALNSITIKKFNRKQQLEKEKQVMEKTVTLPFYYEVHSGIIDYRTGRWIQHDIVDIVTSLYAAREEMKYRRKHPVNANQNALYTVRRYRHGSQVKIT